MSPTEPRNEVVAVRLSADERARVDAAAQRSGDSAAAKRAALLAWADGEDAPKPKGHIHGATLESERIRRIYLFLLERGKAGATSAELSDTFKTVAVSTCVSELRHALKDGRTVSCAYEGKSASGAKIFRYTLNRV